MRNKIRIALAVVAVAACSGSTSSVSSNGTPGSSALEGTWDVTSYGSENVFGSSVTVTGGKLTGSITLTDGPGSCTRKLDFAIEGDAMTGSSTPSTGCTGAAAATLSGTRTASQPASDTPWNGTWTLQEGGSSKKGELTISGLTATSGDFRMTVAGGTATGSGPSRYTFAARRR